MTDPMDPHDALEREMAQVAAFVEDGLRVARRVAREAGIASDRALDRFEQGFMAWETNSTAPQDDPLMMAGWFYHRGLNVGYTVGLAVNPPPKEMPIPPLAGQSAVDWLDDRMEPEEDEPA